MALLALILLLLFRQMFDDSMANHMKGKAMYKRMHILTEADKSKIHATSMNILDEIGINFYEPEAVDIFKQHGFKIDGVTVHLKEAQVTEALQDVPSKFRVEARNPEQSVIIGGDHLVFAPGYGASIMITQEGEQRQGVMTDYNNFCKLVQTSSTINMNGCLMMDPSDRSPEFAHMDMIRSNIVLCDKPFIGSSVSRQAAVDAIEMAGRAWGGKDQIMNKPVMISIISSMLPLQYSAKRCVYVRKARALT